MPKIILNKLPAEVVTLEDAIQKVLNYHGGMVVCVSEGEATILCDSIYNGSDYQKGERGHAFLGLANRCEIHTWTKGDIGNIKNRIEESLRDEAGAEYYYFATLADFARAALENGWT